MKNIFKLLFASMFIVNFSCHDSQNVIDEVLDYETGAILRTISVDNAVLNSSDPNSAFIATVEEQDELDGGLLSEIRVNAMFRDFSPENGTTEAEAFVYSIPASETTVGPVGLPRATINMTFGAAASAMGLTPSDYSPGDVVVVKLEVVLTDGRVFGADSAAGIITGGFFSSPFQYNALLTCSPAPGTYTVHMYDNYGDGWQTGDYSQGLSVDIDGTVVQVAMCSQWGDYEFTCTPTSDGYFAVATVEIPEGTESATWNWPGDQYGEIGLIIVGPGGEIAYSSGTFLSDGSGPYGDGFLAADGYGAVGVGLLPVAVCAE
tara:strand:- start:5041 stop:5997 length:957 start_codon:yes stop_codon:yes gene_type:complete